MSSRAPIILLPYGISVALKLCSIFLDRNVMLGALKSLAAISRAPSPSMNLTGSQQEVIVEHLSYALLKSTTVLTTVTSSLSAAVIVLSARGVTWAPWLLFVFLFLALALIVWIYPKDVHYFGTSGLFGLKKADLATLSFCIYDLILAAFSLVIEPSA